MSVELLTREDVQALEVKLNQILDLLSGRQTDEPKQWLKSAEVKAILNCSDATLKNYRDAGRLPYSKVGGTYYYAQEQVNQMLNTKIRINANATTVS